MAQPVEMSTSGARPESHSPRKIEYLTPPAEVSMTDGYFELASLEHFWVRRRFEVFRKLADQLIGEAEEIAEVGCGHGLLQRQIEEAYGREVTGFDLNENGLRNNVSQFSRVCCYDIYQRERTLRERFDLVFLWDVIEHVRDQDGFVQAVMFHMRPMGKLLVNVPAGEWAFSAYDRAAGHVRRYSARSLHETARRSGLEILRWSYWGLPLLPVMALRKFWLMRRQDLAAAYSSGFRVRSKMLNQAFRFVSECEIIPQRLSGTSLMAVLQREK